MSKSLFNLKGTLWPTWFRHCATSRRSRVRFLKGVIGIFRWYNSSCRTMTSRVDSASNINVYKEYFLVGKGGRCVGLTLPSICADCVEISKPRPSATPGVCQSQYMDSFKKATFLLSSDSSKPKRWTKSTIRTETNLSNNLGTRGSCDENVKNSLSNFNSLRTKKPLKYTSKDLQNVYVHVVTKLKVDLYKVAATCTFFPLNVHTLKRLALGIFAIPPSLVSCCRSIPLSLWRREGPKLQHIPNTHPQNYATTFSCFRLRPQYSTGRQLTHSA